MQPQGKLDAAAMERTVYRHLGAVSRAVVAGPARGLDNAVISLGGPRRMILTTDPVSIVPAVGMGLSAWMSVHLIASDYTTSGLKPEFATFNFNFPPALAPRDRDEYLAAVGDECRSLGVAVVAGHTGSYPGGGFTVVGGGSMFGFCERGDYVLPSMARAGDAIVMTKGAAIEATASLATSFPRFTEARVGRRALRRAQRMARKCSTVADALAAKTVGLGKGGVTSMHDATEGGVLGGLEEMASASGKAFVVDTRRIRVPAECEAVCGAHGIDPLTALSEGTLLITCDRGRSEELVRRLRRNEVGAFEIGSVRKGKGLMAVRRGSSPKKISAGADGYWRAYLRGVRLGRR